MTKYVLFIINQKILLALSYDVESLFTGIPVKKTIKYILHKIDIDKSVKPFSKKSIFKISLVKLTKECVFSVH